MATLASTTSTPSPAMELTLTGLQPIAVKKTIMIINSFVINTTDFLNKFNAIADSKLRRVSQTINRVAIQLSLLETKLEAVEWLKSENLSAVGGAATTNGAAAPPAPSPDAPPAPPMDAASASAAAPPPPPPPPAPAAPQILLKNDPRYSKFFKMIAMGVPKPALRGKVSAEGLDPDVLDMDPEGPAPPGAEDSSSSSPRYNDSPASSDDDDESDDD